jgi:hypothetical protein
MIARMPIIELMDFIQDDPSQFSGVGSIHPILIDKDPFITYLITFKLILWFLLLKSISHLDIMLINNKGLFHYFPQIIFANVDHYHMHFFSQGICNPILLPFYDFYFEVKLINKLRCLSFLKSMFGGSNIYFDPL